MRQRTRTFEWLFVVPAIALGSAGGSAATRPALNAVEITVHFPGEARTAAVVYAREITAGAVTAARIEAGSPRAIVKLPPGRYWLFAEPADPGVPDLLGAHTEWSECQSAPRAEATATCDSHRLAEVVVGRAALTGLVIDDWYLPPDTVSQLDEALHRNPERPDDLELGAPRFSEYPARVLSPATAFQFDPASHPEGIQWESAVRGAAAHGVNFAGHWLVVGSGCGERCASYALIDWSTGRIFVPDALRTVSSALPCVRGQAVQHRADSRLLTVTQPADGNVETRYYVWDETRGSLSEIASYRSSAQRYCAGH
jgi:hypothetical protein